MSLTIITGLACSGKTSLAKHYASLKDAEVIHRDEYRYFPPSTWTKAPKDMFIHNVCQAIQDKLSAGRSVIYEGTYHDAHDPENASEELIRFCLSNFPCKEVIILKTSDQVDHVARLFKRSFNRALGIEDQGSARETPESVARLLIKNIEYWKENTEALESLATSVINSNIPCTQAALEDLLKN